MNFFSDLFFDVVEPLGSCVADCETACFQGCYGSCKEDCKNNCKGDCTTSTTQNMVCQFCMLNCGETCQTLAIIK